MRQRNWESDGVGGGPSSMEVLLEWLSMAGNAARWRRSAGKGDGSRSEITHEICDVLLSYDIDYRTPSSIGARLWALERQLDEADEWLKRRGLRNYDVSRRTEDAVLQMCPYYPEIKPLLRPMQPASAARPRVNRFTIYSNDKGSAGDMEYHSSSSSDDDEEELPKVGTKREASFGPHALHPEDSKRARIDQTLQTVKLEDTKCVAVLEADPDERREFFKLELQVKRDEAILMRAKARKEMLDLGVPLHDINRLLPL
ncbi:uncharacterized protein IUM83_09594 [Phytophthora cinnamomi]|uniref:uncharacterized protein n=2 Tax=Phytophthora cinnamomi TaxID=4785 RepID=UPI003559382D|nr:hypothetical protein IUM83_09594 [Phytophthora cinnamomi]